MRILMYDYEYPPLGGGGGVSHHFLAAELAREHEVVVVTSAFERLPRREVVDGVEVHRVPVLGRAEAAVASLSSMLAFPPSAWAHAARALRGRRFDVVNSHFVVPTGPGSLPVARRLGIPHVQTIHGGDIFDPSKRLSPHRLPLVRSLVGRILRASDAVVAQSTDTRDNARELYVPELDVHIIPLAIRVPRVAPATRAELGLPPDAFLAVTVGRLLRRKALDRLLAALAQPDCGQAHLVIVGEGPEGPGLEALTAELGLGARVHFAGWVEEARKWQILAAADAYVSSTMHEGYGLVFLEAMAMGLPLVTPDRGGHLDFLEDGVTGFIVPNGDAPALAGAIARLLRDPEIRARMGHTNRERSHESRLEVMAARYADLFGATIEARRARGR